MSMTILDRIVETKRKEVAAAKARTPAAALREAAAELPRCRNFSAAMTAEPAGGANLIAEIKRASPSAGLIREDLDPVAIAEIYAEAGATAVSVLTDESYFQGRLAYVTQVKRAVGLPILRKDFIIDSYQVLESRAAGADAILLIAACLRPAEIMDLIILAAELSMTCLLEVHDADELLQVRSLVGFPRAGYVLLGINNRDLATFTVDLGTTCRLAELVDDPRVLVSESGIHTADDVRRLGAAGVRNLLVGESLMRADDIGAHLRSLIAAPAGP